MTDVSVVIPMYNSENTIIPCLESVLGQTYLDPVQIIIVNDGATDNSLKVVQDYIEINNIKHIDVVNKVNGGVATARNAGIRLAKGKYIALLDSDDLWLPNKLELQLGVLKLNPQIDFIGCNKNSEKIRVWWKEYDKLSKITLKTLLIKMFPQTSTVIFKREIISDVGLYDESLRYGEDGDYWYRISILKEFYFMPESLVYYGDGKSGFGFSGMTSKLAEMHEGEIISLKKLVRAKHISYLEYLFFLFYMKMKYFRRVLITKMK